MIKVIIFDADGVLLNQERFSDSFSRDYGIPIEKISPFFTREFRDCLMGKADLKEVLTPYLSIWGWTQGVDKLLHYWFEREHNFNLELFDYVQSLRKKGIVCFLATDNEKHRFAWMLDKLGFAQGFDGAYSSAHVGHSKANPQFFSSVLDNLKGISKNEILFFDDDTLNIESAKEFGINAELYTSFNDFKEKMKGYLAEDLF